MTDTQAAVMAIGIIVGVVSVIFLVIRGILCMLGRQTAMVRIDEKPSNQRCVGGGVSSIGCGRREMVIHTIVRSTVEYTVHLCTFCGNRQFIEYIPEPVAPEEGVPPATPCLGA